MNKMLLYFLPIVAYYCAVLNISNNSFIIITAMTSIAIAIVVIFINLYYNIFYKSKEEKEELYWENALKLASVLINIAFFVSIFEYSFYAGLLVIWLILSILLHEAWHFFFATRNWVKISKFSVGFWLPIIEFKFKWIKWRFSNLLFGGYVEFKDEEVLKDIKWKKDFKEIEKIVESRWLKIKDLYLFKKLKQKLPILFWWVLVNLLIAYFSLMWFLMYSMYNSHYIWWQAPKLTEKQRQYLIKEMKKNKTENQNIISYLKEKVGKTIWLWTKKINWNSLAIVWEAWKELYKWIELTYYSLIYSTTHPKYFTKFQSVVWVGKTVAKQDKEGFMNYGILLIIIAIVNISLFVINLLPIPAVDWWQIIKEIIAHSLVIWKKIPEKYIIYMSIALSKTVEYIEYSWFAIITIYWLYLVFKDIFIT